MKKAEMMRLALIDSIGHWENNVEDLKENIGKNPYRIIDWNSSSCACCQFEHSFTGMSGDKPCVDSCIIGINFGHCLKTPWADFDEYVFKHGVIDKKMISLAEEVPDFLKRLYFKVYGMEN